VAVERIGTLVDALADWTERLMPDPARARRLRSDLGQLLGPTGTTPSTPLSAEVLATVERTCHRTARHLTLTLHDEDRRPDTHPPGWPPVTAAEVAARAGHVRSVLRDGPVGGLRLDGFDELSAAGRHLRGAFALLRGCEGLVLDLRSNGGGALSSLALVAELVLGPEPTQLVTVHRRDRPPRQWWTTGGLGELALPATARVAVLVGPGTYSSGEALAYHLQQRRRVRVFGSRTPGAADHVTPVRVTARVTALMPEATPVDPVSGGSWEGVGVSPDVTCSGAEAPVLAGEWVRGRTGDPASGTTRG
jgi:C-terminal processing protease CtpA/Prc